MTAYVFAFDFMNSATRIDKLSQRLVRNWEWNEVFKGFFGSLLE